MVRRFAGLTLVAGLLVFGFTTDPTPMLHRDKAGDTEILVVDLSKKMPSNPYQTEYERMLYPTVRIKTLFSTGSGVVIDDYIITAAHVVGNQSIITVEIFTTENTKDTEIPAIVVMTDTVKDLALIKTPKFLPYSARLAPKEYKPYIFNPVYAVGCSLGLKPRPSSGIISVIEDSYWGISAPILPGNSGGPVYDANTHEVIGIAVWINTCQGQLVPTMSGIVPINQIYEFLEPQINTDEHRE